jgi:soluble lytic murein transglycosylase-like protein
LRHLATLLFASFALACGYPDPGVHARVERWARAFGLDPLLLGAVVWVESKYCVGAVGRAGEVGLGQVKPATASGLGIDPQHLAHPDHNLYAAARYLRELYLAFGDWTLALAAYNRGPGRVRRKGVDAKGQAYVRKVLTVYAYWKQTLVQRGRGGDLWGRESQH